MKKTVLLAASALAATGLGAADVSAVDVEMYGQVNKSLMFYDDGRDTETNVVDNDFSSTRFGFKGSQGLDNGLTASVLFEVEMQSNPSDTITQRTTAGVQSTPSSSGGTFAERQARVGLAGDWGAVFLGQMSTATDYVTEQDLAGVEDVLGSDAEDIGGGLGFRLNTGAMNSITSGANGTYVTVADVNDNMDGNGRADAIRYDSPIFNGFQLRGSAAQGGDVDGGLFYNGKVDAFAVKAGVGYVAFNSAASASSNIVTDQWSGSVSVKHDSGLAGTVAYGQKSLDRKATGVDEPTSLYAKLGYGWDAFEVAADWSKSEDTLVGVAADHELSHVGVGAQYNMGNGASVAGYYKQFDLDYTGVTTDEINVYGVNLRVKF